MLLNVHLHSPRFTSPVQTIEKGRRSSQLNKMMSLTTMTTTLTTKKKKMKRKATKQAKRTRCPRPALSAAKSTTSPDLKLWTNCMKSTFVFISSWKLRFFTCTSLYVCLNLFTGITEKVPQEIPHRTAKSRYRRFQFVKFWKYFFNLKSYVCGALLCYRHMIQPSHVGSHVSPRSHASTTHGLAEPAVYSRQRLKHRNI